MVAIGEGGIGIRASQDVLATGFLGLGITLHGHVLAMEGEYLVVEVVLRSPLIARHSQQVRLVGCHRGIGLVVEVDGATHAIGVFIEPELPAAFALAVEPVYVAAIDGNSGGKGQHDGIPTLVVAIVELLEGALVGSFLSREVDGEHNRALVDECKLFGHATHYDILAFELSGHGSTGREDVEAILVLDARKVDDRGIELAEVDGSSIFWQICNTTVFGHHAFQNTCFSIVRNTNLHHDGEIREVALVYFLRVGTAATGRGQGLAGQIVFLARLQAFEVHGISLLSTLLNDELLNSFANDFLILVLQRDANRAIEDVGRRTIRPRPAAI